VPLDQYSPIDMRAPGAAHGVHALEVAMDELAHALRMDPLALRLKNYAERNPMDGHALLHQGARAPATSRAPSASAGRRGRWSRAACAKATSGGLGHGHRHLGRDADVRARQRGVPRDGRLVVSSAATDIGTGTYTVMSMIAAAAMGLPLERVSFQLGDSTLPVAPIEGGSSHVTTVGSAVQGACEKLQRKLLKHGRALPHSPVARAGSKEVSSPTAHPPAQVARKRNCACRS
jgi:xanthine dehydrogenase YagR molybdenum-binding subunit